MKKVLGLFCAMLLIFGVLILAASPVNAGIIQFNFEGYVTYSELVEGQNQGQPIPGAPTANTPISGYYIFQAPSIDSYAGDTHGHYDNLISLIVNIGALTYTFTESNPYAQGYIEVDNNAGTLYVRDRYSVTVSGNTSYDVFTGPMIGDFKLYNFLLSLFDWGGNVDPDFIQDDSLPLLAPDLGLLTDAYNFGNNATTEIVFSYADGETRGKLRGEVTSLTDAVPEPVEIDIKPNSWRNIINRRGWGFIPVAILSDGDFDATSKVDRTSLTFGQTGDEDSRWFCLRRGWDVDRNGYRDLVCFFWNKKAGFQCGDEEGILKGQTKDGTPIEGSDSVRIVPCR